MGCWASQEAIRSEEGTNPLSKNTPNKRQFLHGISQRSLDILQERDFTIFVGSWNVGNACPPDDLSPWLDKSADILVIGTQECLWEGRGKGSMGQAMSIASHALDKDHFKRSRKGMTSRLATHKSMKAVKHEPFFKLVEHSLGEEFKVVQTVKLTEMRLIVCAKKDILPYVTDVWTSREACGIGHVVGNKGGLCVGFSLRGQTLGFISAHLAAHEGKIEARNQNIREILGGTKSPTGMHVDESCDHFFFCGDLNYRVELDLDDTVPPKQGGVKTSEWSYEEKWNYVSDLIKKEDWSALERADELKYAMKSGSVFYGFEEGKLDFAPTFKMERAEGNSYIKKRIPSYCDRVLWYSRPALKKDVQLVSFGPTDLTTSDHKPVGALFKVKSYGKATSLATHSPCAKIMLTNLACTNLAAKDHNNFSDPYIKFTSPEIFGDKKYKTPVKLKNLNPTWKDEEVPVLLSRCPSVNALANHHLHMRVYDEDKLLKNELIGTTVIQLDEALRVSPEPIDFDLPLAYHTSITKGAGRIRGKIRIELPEGQATVSKSKPSTETEGIILQV